MNRIPYTRIVKSFIRSQKGKFLLLGVAYLILQGLVFVG